MTPGIGRAQTRPLSSSDPLTKAEVATGLIIPERFPDRVGSIPTFVAGQATGGGGYYPPPCHLSRQARSARDRK